MTLEDHLGLQDKGEGKPIASWSTQYLEMLTELNRISKLSNRSEVFCQKMRERKVSLRFLTVTFVKNSDDYQWVIEHKEVTDFEVRRYFAVMMLQEVREGNEASHEMLIDRFQTIATFQKRHMLAINLLSSTGLIMNEAFQVATIIEKLLPMWKDYKNYLKHKRKEMIVKDLIVRLRIEEDNKAIERRSKGNSTIDRAHIVEDDQNNSKKRKKAEQGSHQPKKKFKGKCFNYGKICHKSTDCRAPKKGKKKDQTNMIEFNKECDDLCAIFSECNLVGNPREWWMDSGATRYVCANKELFSSFAPAQVEEMIYMANSATAKIEGTGKVGLKMTS
ncbi:putative glucan endo-1,3-beta-glucosidase A-like [Capsicum annuum]|nr:putative glucan endo-1,3-beta-glucosidase A-like [Capsicum annuum]KAF3664409.1 putative glucan endo-1,3-beta-glucosidase A-like [Capsicum annuum]